MSYNQVKNFRQKLKSNLCYVHGAQCSICGYNRCESALEFHHLNADEKSFTLGTNANIATEKALEESKKCILVCANCHREIHADLIDSSTLHSSFCEEKAKIVLEALLAQKTKQKNFCQDCGMELFDSRAKRCITCANLARRVCERPSRELLKSQIRTISFVELGKIYNVSDKAISKWCKSMNLPDKKSIIKKYSDEEWKNL